MALKSTQEYLAIKAGYTIGNKLPTKQELINILAGTSSLTEQDAWNIYAGTTKRCSVQECANIKAGIPLTGKLLTIQEACALI